MQFKRSSLLAALTLLCAASVSRADVLHYSAILTGPSESPPNASPGIGDALVDIDTTAQTMHVQIDFSGLLGTTTAVHIHSATATPGAGTAGTATQTPSLTGFPAGVTSGSYDQTFSMALDGFYNPPFETANGGTAASAETALLGGIAAGEAYVDIHTTVVPGGEIRGFLEPVPEPASLSLCAAGSALLLFRRRRK